jgi:ferrous iron transport protein B
MNSQAVKKIEKTASRANGPNTAAKITVALVGSPNSGKTTIFNNMTGARQHVGNYPGVTVEQKTGQRHFRGINISIIDLPGTYSLTAFSEEEVVTRNYLLNNKPDVVINIIDASNLERNLYLTTQLIELGCKMVLVFNMSDLMVKNGTSFNIDLLSQLLGAPIVMSIGSKNVGTPGIFEKTLEVFESNEMPKKVEIKYGDEIENEITRILNTFKNYEKYLEKYNKRWLAVKILEQDSIILKELSNLLPSGFFEQISAVSQKSLNHINKILGLAPSTVIAESRYGFINGALKESAVHKIISEISLSDRIDQVLLNRVFGLPIFAVIMWAIFQLVFKIGDYPTRWLQLGFDSLSSLVSRIMPPGMLSSLIVDGIIGGVGGVLVFTPKIMILFICIAVLEDSGYMARAAFIMDRIMHKIGLHGKSFIPMLIGFGCTVPAYMCTRTLENKNDRMITMHINTFMSCGGRLPIYILFAGTFFADNAGNVIFSLYIIGILMAVAFARILRATRFKGESEPFVMELPVYRVPTLRGVAMHMWERTWQYIKKAGTVILAISIIIWILFSFPRISDSYVEDYGNKVSLLEQSLEDGSISESEYIIRMESLKEEMTAIQLEYSAAGKVGHFIEPVFKPLGFDWRLGLAAVTGIAGKEVVVSTLGTTFSLSGANNESQNLRQSLKNTYNPLTGYNFMLFSLLYFPCIASLAVFQREAGTKEMFFQAGFTLLLAWVVSCLVFQIGRIFI